MIQDISDLADQGTLQTDVAIVGSGLAGAHLARHLTQRGLAVTLLESGDNAFDQDIESLNDLNFVGKPHRVYTPESSFHRYLPENYRGKNRLRMLGGTSASWTGKWRAFRQSDFESEPWIPDSDWPIGLDDLMPFYRVIAKEYGIGDVFAAEEEPSYEQMKANLMSLGLDLVVHYWQAQTTRVIDHFRDALKQSPDIRTVLRATATELVLSDDLDRVSTVRCQSLDGKRLDVEARWVVLAMGGVEGARLLLASNKQKPQGVGNDHDVVGRYYLEHLKEHTSKLIPGENLRPLIPHIQSQPRPRFCFGFSLNEAERTKHQLLRHGVFCEPKYEKTLGRLKKRLLGSPAFTDEIGTLSHYTVKVATEHVPHPDSRVYLGKEPDAMGIPKLVVDWRFTDIDHTSLRMVCERFKAIFAKAGFGEMNFSHTPMTIDATTDAAHPMGSTRMAADPSKGVVDRDCKVFGVDNLYIASSSVFPTGAVYSPTYTILALAHRITEQLVERSK